MVDFQCVALQALLFYSSKDVMYTTGYKLKLETKACLKQLNNL